jgi:serine-type D-Ala-D-Ala carboxypeptidase (penicillin-binding protein 5/6)
MRTSRALGALALACAIALPTLPAAALTPLPVEDPPPPGTSAPASEPAGGPGQDLQVTTPSGQQATIELQADGAVTAPPVAADSWVLADLDSGEVLASQNADLPVRPASTLKLLTALTVAPRLAPEQPYRAVKGDEQAEGNRVVLYAGLEYSVGDLLHAALLPSANDAADALARANGGLAATVEQMNAEADRLGASRTTARNPSGLDEDGQVTTALDMALIGRAAYANPEVAAALLRREVPFPGKLEGGKRVIYPIYNANRTVAHDRFDGYLGGKSGYTSRAGNTLVAAGERDGRRLLVTLFRIGGNTYRAGEALLAWGFANAGALQPVGQLVEPSGPAPQFDRTIIPLPEKGAAPVTREAFVAASSDAPTATVGSSSAGMPTLRWPGLPSLPSPLTVLTMLLGVVVLLRARVYWITHRHRTAWVELDAWAREQARSTRHRAPTDRRTGAAAPRHRAVADDALVSARR